MVSPQSYSEVIISFLQMSVYYFPPYLGIMSVFCECNWEAWVIRIFPSSLPFQNGLKYKQSLVKWIVCVTLQLATK